jgi:hypothetical protein
MEFIEDIAQLQQGVGATAEARLVLLTPLIEFYAREMGELPGRLMIATSFLGDLQLMPDWSLQTTELHEAVEQAQALIVSVMIRMLNEQDKEGCDCGGGSDSGLAAAVRRFLDQC